MGALSNLLTKVEKDVASTRATIHRAERRCIVVYKAQMGEAGQKKVGIVMGEFKAGTLKSSSGEPVTDKAQALAIALSEARKVDKSLEEEIGEGTIEEQNEHGFTPQQALQVALDHLKKNPRYYTLLKKYGLD